MTSYSLKPISASTNHILRSRVKVGYVNKGQDGWHGVIGTHREVRSTAHAAFEAVAIKALGFDSRAALDASNREVAARNAARNAERREEAFKAFDALGRGNYEPLLDLLKNA